MTLGYRADIGQSYESIERHAATIRQKLGVQPNARLPGIGLFESLDKLSVVIQGRLVGVEPIVEDLPKEGSTRYRQVPERFEVVLDPATYDRLERADDPRARFTLGHELGHLVFHSKLLMGLNEIPHETRALMRERSRHASFLDTEWQANAMAGALLLPAEGIRELLHQGGATTQSIAEHFGASIRCTEIRLEVYSKHKNRLLL